MIQLRDMGLAQGQIWALDDLAADCAADGQYDFFLSATPHPAHRSIGRHGRPHRRQVARFRVTMRP